MNAIFFDWHDYEDSVLKKFKLNYPENITFKSETFNINDALGYSAVSIFVNSRISNEELDKLKANKCEMLLLRSAGFNMLDTEHAKLIGLKVYRVASYSPESVAEFVFALILCLARNLPLELKHQEAQKNLIDIRLMGFVLQGKTIGIHGYGKIGREVANVARNGFKMNVLYFDPYFKDDTVDQKAESLEVLYSRSDIVSIHVPLNKETEGSVTKTLLANVKDRFMLINTSRGSIVNSEDIEELLASKKIDYLGTDVWEDNDNFDRDLLVSNSVQTEHIAFFTEEAVKAILEQTLESLLNTPRKENII